MGKSAKRLKVAKQLNHQTTSDMAAVVYAKTAELSKDDLVFLKQHLNNQLPTGSQGKARHKSNATKKQIATFGFQNDLCNPTASSQNQTFMFQSSGSNTNYNKPQTSFMAQQQEMIQLANQYIQKYGDPPNKALKKVSLVRSQQQQQRRNNRDLISVSDALRGECSTIQEEQLTQKKESIYSPALYNEERQGMFIAESISPRLQEMPLTLNDKTQQTYEEPLPCNLLELKQQVSLSVNSNYHAAERRISSSNQMNLPAKDEGVDNNYHSSASNYARNEGANNCQSMKKQSALSSMRKPINFQNVLNQISTPFTKVNPKGDQQTFLPSLGTIDKTMQLALTAYGKEHLSRVIPQQEFHSPRDAQRSSLMIQQRGGLIPNSINQKAGAAILMRQSQVTQPMGLNIFPRNDNSSSQGNLLIASQNEASSNQQPQSKVIQQSRITLSPKRYSNAGNQQKPSPFTKTILQHKRISMLKDVGSDKLDNVTQQLVFQPKIPQTSRSLQSYEDSNDIMNDDEDDDDSSEENNENGEDRYEKSVFDNIGEECIEQEMNVHNTICVTQRDQSTIQNNDQVTIQDSEKGDIKVGVQPDSRSILGFSSDIPNPSMTQPNFNKIQGSFASVDPKSKVLKKERAEKEKPKINTATVEPYITCLVISIEPYIKRAMLKLGWGLLNVGQVYNVRYDITDKEGTHNKLLPRQWYNHFPNN